MYTVEMVTEVIVSTTQIFQHILLSYSTQEKDIKKWNQSPSSCLYGFLLGKHFIFIVISFIVLFKRHCNVKLYLDWNISVQSHVNPITSMHFR